MGGLLILFLRFVFSSPFTSLGWFILVLFLLLFLFNDGFGGSEEING